MHKVVGYIERDPETGLYVEIVPGIPGAHTQAETLDELQKNLKEVVELCLEEMESEAQGVTERPEKEATTKRSSKPRKSYVPPKDHPWRRWQSRESTTKSMAHEY